MCRCNPSIKTPFCGQGDCVSDFETSYQPRTKTTFSRRLVKPEDMNPSGALFGGKMMMWIDEEAAIYAMCKLKTRNVVTAHIGEINFKAPSFSGDVIQFDSAVVKYGRTSITTSMVIKNKFTGDVICEIDKMVFVSVDPVTRKSVEHNQS